MAKHVLEDQYLSEPANLPNSAEFTTGYVGLGPYRLVQWDRGSHMQFERFEGYYRGRPAFDQVVLRFVGDPNTMVANVLAGEVDIVLPTGVDIETAMEVKQQWEGTGNQVLIAPMLSVLQVNPQHRPEYARPRNGLTQVPVRQALYQAIDRQAVVELVSFGLDPIADSYIPATRELRPQVESAIPQYPYDVRAAQELLAKAGWTRGPDGVLVHSPNGERFDLMLRAKLATKDQKIQHVIADFWKQVGIEVEIDVTPTALANDREYRLTTPGAWLFNYPADTFHPNLNSEQIASPTNRWSGGNHTGYVNPRVDELLDKLDITIDARERVAIHRELVREEMANVAVLPMFWRSEPVLALKEMKGVKGTGTSNIFEWDKG